MAITFCPTIVTTEAEHIEGLQKPSFAELAIVIVCRVLIACSTMGIPCLRVGKEISTKASISWVVLATYCVRIPQDFAVCSNAAHEAEGCHTLLRAMLTLESVGRISLTCQGVLITCR